MPLRTGELEAGPKRAAINTGRAILKGAPFSRPKRRAWVAPKQEFIDHVNAVSHQLKKRQKQRRCVFIPGQSPWLPWSDLLTFAALGTRIHAARKSKARTCTTAASGATAPGFPHARRMAQRATRMVRRAVEGDGAADAAELVPHVVDALVDDVMADIVRVAHACREAIIASQKVVRINGKVERCRATLERLARQPLIKRSRFSLAAISLYCGGLYLMLWVQEDGTSMVLNALGLAF